MTEAVVCGFLNFIPRVFQFIANINCNRVIGVVLPKASGKSCVARDFIKDKQTDIIDIESVVRLTIDNETLKKLDELKGKKEMTSYNTMFYPICKNYIDNIRKNFKNKKLIVLSSDRTLLKYCGTEKTFVFVPSNEFSNKIKASLEPDVSALFEANKTDILLNAGLEKINVFNDFNELAQLLGKILKLRYKL
jgi:hypothetical protein